MLYWPIVATAPQPSPQAIARIAAYMKNGGTIIFDTRDALTARPGRPADGGSRMVAPASRRHRCSAVGARSRRSRRDQDILSSRRISKAATPTGRPGSRHCRRPIPPMARGRRARATAFRRSSSPRTISLPAGPRTAMASRFIRWSRAARASTNSRCAAASIS